MDATIISNLLTADYVSTLSVFTVVYSVYGEVQYHTNIPIDSLTISDFSQAHHVSDANKDILGRGTQKTRGVEPMLI